MSNEAKATKKKTRSARGTGRLYKRTPDGKEFPSDNKTPGVFWIQYTINGKRERHALTGKDGKPITDLRKAEAERKRLTAPMRAGKREEQLEAMTAALERATGKKEQAKDEAIPAIPLSEAWEVYKVSQKRKKQTRSKTKTKTKTGQDTLRYYSGYWNVFMEWLEVNEPDTHCLQDVTQTMAEAYADYLISSGLSANTYNKHTGFLELLFFVLGKQAGIKKNPFSEVGREELNTKSRRELTIAELKEILTKAEGDLQTLLTIGTFTGLRLGDCCTLSWGEVDLDRGLITRIPNKTAKKGKSVRLGIPPALFDILAMIPPIKRKGYILPRFAELYTYRNKDGRPTKQPNISNEIQKHFKACGIQVHKIGTGYIKAPDPTGKHEYIWKHTGKRAVVEVGFHSLRHTYVSLHAERGTPQAMIQGNVAHSSPAMTAHYTHVSEEAAVRTAQVLVLDDPKPAALTVPDWIAEKLEGMTAKNWKQIKGELLEVAR
ncbi:hypothetical protein SCARR_03192 [Pontiella sulfatireligans]|uniref:Tyr recombinase domain-containing protein n=2 Tax=Pontiella sulfatireligans TaxID=2750658 RepID=A0A6C2ULJ4_9BACT|nr:hypothetical protein SCARR_03192 [Pontiella sulfatireligans]